MQISYAEWVCPECKTKNREDCNTWMYGTPIRTCKACRSEYLDRRWREVAIDGFDPRSNNAKVYAKGVLLFLAIAAAGGAMTQFGGGPNHTKALAICISGCLLTITCAIMALRIKFGFQNKDNQKFLEESRARLRDPQYVKKLESFGYKVPRITRT